LTNAVGSGCYWSPWSVKAVAGGQVLLTNLTGLDGYTSVLADGGNSVVNLSSLADLRSPTATTLQENNGGRILLPPPVDLVLTELGSPATALAGQPIQISWTVRNQGVNPASGARADGVWLSTDRVVGGDTFLGHFPASTALAAGQEQAVTNTVILPPGLNGSYYFIVMADSQYQFYEAAAETNNTFIATNAIVVSAPDLAIVGSLVGTNSSAKFGDKVWLSWVVKNVGSVPASGWWRDRVYLSSGGSVAADSVLLAGEGSVHGLLAAGESYTNSFEVTLPLNAGLAAKGYYLVAKADAFNVLAEANESNNTQYRSLSVTYPNLPDLVAANVSSRSNAIPGEAVPVVWTVTNAGATTASAPWTEAVYFVGDEVTSLTNAGQLQSLLTSAPTVAWVGVTNDLAAGASVTRTQMVAVPMSGPAGALKFAVWVDRQGDVVEQSETNNAVVAEAATLVPQTLTLFLPVNRIAENTQPPTLTAQLSRNGSLSNALQVTILSDNTNALKGPASVALPAGEASTVFPLTVQPDGVMAGNRLVHVRAEAAGYLPGSNSVTVLDSDVRRLSISVVAPAVLEGMSVPVTVSRDAADATPLLVKLASSSPARLQPPEYVSIPANSNSWTFSLLAVENTAIEPSASVSLTASATGFQSASTSVLVNDNDLPTLQLSLEQSTVSENAGPQATFATLTRSINGSFSRDLTILLSSSDKNIAIVPASATIPMYQTSTRIPVAVVDNQRVDGSKLVTLYAWIAGTGTSAIIGPTYSTNLTVVDNDGPMLTVTIDHKVVPEGFTNAAIGSVSRNTSATNSVLVSLQSSDLAEAFVPASVVLSTGQSSVTFPISTLNDGIKDGSQQVSISARADGYAEGSAVFTVTDGDLPDLVIESITFATNALTDELFSVGYRVRNQGLAPATNSFKQRIYLSRTPFVGDLIPLEEAQITLGTNGLPPGVSFGQSIAKYLSSLAPGDYWVVVTADFENAVPESNKDNNTLISTVPLHLGEEYSGSVQADVKSVPTGTPIPFHGVAVNHGNRSLEGRMMDIEIVVRGMNRRISTQIRAGNTFSDRFIPLPGEAGQYTIAAAHPQQPVATAQDTFTILGMNATPDNLDLKLAEGSSVTGQLLIENPSDLPLDNLVASLPGLPTNLLATVSLSTNFLDGFAQMTLGYAIAALDATVPQLSFQIRLTNNAGALLVLPVQVTVEPHRPRLVAYPGELLAGMLRGGQRVLEFELVNEGGAESGPINAALPDVPWVQLGVTNPIPSLAPGQTNRVTLLLTPPANLVLGPYTGQIAFMGQGVTLLLPFTFRAVSEARGDLKIVAEDEYTYYAVGLPHLTNATVTVRDPYSHLEMFRGVTDAQGEWSAAQLAEGYYEVVVTADRHATFRRTALVLPGETTQLRAFLSRQTVQYVWHVVPTEIPDRTRITIETVFETYVPVPVVTVEPALIDLTEITNDVTQIDLKISNHGLIAALETRLFFGTHPEWQFSPLINDIGTLPAMSSLTIPLTIRKTHAGVMVTQTKSSARRQAKDGGEDCVGVGAGVTYIDICAGQLGAPIILRTLDPTCGGGGFGWVPGPRDDGIPGGGGGGGWGWISPGPGEDGGGLTLCDPCFLGWVQAGAECALSFAVSDTSGCTLDSAKCLKALWESGLKGNLKDCVGASISCSEVLVKTGSKWIPVVGQVWTAYGCVQGGVDAYNNCKDGGTSKSRAKDVAQASSGEGGLNLVMEHLDRVQKQLAVMEAIVGNNAWFVQQPGEAFGAWFTTFVSFTATGTPDASLIAATERAQLHALPAPDGVSAAAIDQFIDRWNRSVTYWNLDIFYTKDVPAGQSADFISYEAYSEAITEAANALAKSQAEGFSDTLAGLRWALLQIQMRVGVRPRPTGGGDSARQPKDGGGGVCARVRLQIDQDVVMARDAFNATLEILNSSGNPLTGVGLDIVVRNAAGEDVTALFGVRPPRLTQISAVDGTGVVASEATGQAVWTVVPGSDAAPDSAQRFYVSGTMRYTAEGLAVEIPLAPAEITVQPNPKLVVKYFHQRDVFSDDPFTPEIEPSIPFSLAVMVQNQGKGVARDVTVTSAQPKIIENEKGLLIDFKIVATEVAGQNMTPSLTANFGSINPGQIAIGRWLLSSTLQGLFIDYKASFEHLDGLGNKKLSLIDRVEIHEMTHLVQAGGSFEDGKPDFLVNDGSNARNLPDTLYLSDGRIEPVSVIESGIFSDAPGSGHMVVTMSVNAPSGWAYLRLPELGAGQYALATVRRSDGAVLNANNFWQTDRTFIGMGRRPIRENILHVLDYHGTGGQEIYTLTYVPKAQLDTTPPVSAVLPLPADSYAQIPLQWSGQDEPGGSGVASYDIRVSDNGGDFTPWLTQTTATGAIYPVVPGHRYEFYSVAIDRAGNRESAPGTPDAHTTVTLSNVPPVLTVGTNQTVDEGATVFIPNSATDANAGQILTFSLGVPRPAGAYINASSGLITWPTSEATGPSTNLFTVMVADNGLPPMSATGYVTVVVREVNLPPILAVVTNRVINEGFLLLITNSASDYDFPASALTFSLGGVVPAGATINSNSGVFRWQPTDTQGPSTNLITVIVTDDGVPPLSATQQFYVVVRDTNPDFVLSLGSTNLFTGEANSVLVTLQSGIELTYITFDFEAADGRLTNWTLVQVAGEVASGNISSPAPNRYRVALVLNPANMVSGSRPLARLDFMAVPAAGSAFVPLGVDALVGIRNTGLPVVNVSGLGGRVAIVDRQPLVDATHGPAGLPVLVLYGHPSTTYILQSTPNMLVPQWSDDLAYPLTNRFQVFEIAPATIQPTRFFRAREW
jgi:subtilase family serine protease